MARVSAGRMNDIITYGTLKYTSDGQGGSSAEFEPLGRVYARVERGTEQRSIDGDDRSVLVIDFVSRYLAGVNPTMALKLNSSDQIWHIDDIADTRGRGESLAGRAWTEVLP